MSTLTWLLFYFLIIHNVVVADDEFVMNRVRVMKNTAKQCSVRMHGNSPDLVMFHAILKFSSHVNTHHNALFIDQSSVIKYNKIMQEDRQQISIRSRHIKRILSYHTLGENATDEDANDDGYNDKLYNLVQSVRFFGVSGGASDVSYDGVLLLDAYSAIWNEYNVAVFTNSELALSYVLNGSLSEQVAEYDGLTRLDCDTSFNSDQCLVVTSGGGLEVNGRLFPTYRVILDLDSPLNLLPIDLYMMWLTPGNDTLSIKLGNTEDNYLHLNSEFEYEMHQSNVILLGVDVLHHAPRLEYSVKKRAFRLWYHKEHVTHYETHEIIKTLFMFANLILLFSLFQWSSSYNYLILEYIIEFACIAKQRFYFAHKQVLYEMVVLCVTLFIIIVTLSIPQNACTDYHVRKSLFIGFLIYYLILGLIILIVYRKVILCALKHYFPGLYTWRYGKTKRRRTIALACFDVLPYGELFTDDVCDFSLSERLHYAVVGLYHDPLIRLPTQAVIVKNSVFIQTLLLSLALLFNFYTPDNHIYLILIVSLSFSFIYYGIKYLVIAAFYLGLFKDNCSSKCDKNRNAWLILYMIAQVIVLIIYTRFMYESICVACFNLFNSTHSQVAVAVYVIILIALVILAPILMVAKIFNIYAEPLIACAIEKVKQC